METVGCEEDVSGVLKGAASVEGGSGLIGAAPGVGLPRRCPPPEKGWYFFFGMTYFSEC